MKDLLQVHPETEANDCRLQQKSGEVTGFPVQAMNGGQPEDQPHSQRNRRTDQAGRGYDHAGIKDRAQRHVLRRVVGMPIFGGTSLHSPNFLQKRRMPLTL